MLNPNRTFKDREFKGGTGMMITLDQKHVLTGFTMRQGVKWRDLCMSTIGKYKNMSDCTFYEAALCVGKVRSWKSKKGAEIK